MFKNINVLDEKDPILRKKSEKVVFPLSKEEKSLINDMLRYLEASQTEEVSEKYNLRPGMGLAAPQVGINKRFFVIVEELEDGSFKDYVIINPKIISNSVEKIFAATGEGCLSVNREVEGIVPRFARVKVTYQDIDGKVNEIRVREEVAIAFQHEIDHLNGILFFDHINKKDPFKGFEEYREI